MQLACCLPYNGVHHQVRGGAVRWARNRDDTRQPASFALRCKRLKTVWSEVVPMTHNSLSIDADLSMNLDSAE